MCRWLAYSGSAALLLEDALFAPAHSLIDQSMHSRLGAEHAHEAIVHGQLRQDALERDALGKAARARTTRFVHLGHTARRDATHELVIAELGQLKRTRLHQPSNVAASLDKSM